MRMRAGNGNPHGYQILGARELVTYQMAGSDLVLVMARKGRVPA
jgi:hypothetical protein